MEGLRRTGRLKKLYFPSSSFPNLKDFQPKKISIVGEIKFISRQQIRVDNFTDFDLKWQIKKSCVKIGSFEIETQIYYIFSDFVFLILLTAPESAWIEIQKKEICIFVYIPSTHLGKPQKKVLLLMAGPLRPNPPLLMARPLREELFLRLPLGSTSRKPAFLADLCKFFLHV